MVKLPVSWQTTQMGGPESDDEPRDEHGIPESRRALLAPWGWLLMGVGLIWVWLVFFTRQAEIGLGIGAALFGLGYLLQRSGSRAP
jgi:hypothetical protein